MLIEKGALIEAANKVRIHSHATTCAQASLVKVVYSKLMTNANQSYLKDVCPALTNLI